MSRVLPQRCLPSTRRMFSTRHPRQAFATGPAPPRLPPKEQEEFERLQRASTGAFSTPRPSAALNSNPSTATSNDPNDVRINISPAASQRSPPQINQSPVSTPPSSGSAKETEDTSINATVKATGKGDELHPDIMRGAKPEFEGDVNPVTGEVGGPKNEPLRWGSTGDRGDWSYNGRVTDF